MRAFSAKKFLISMWEEEKSTASQDKVKAAP